MCIHWYTLLGQIDVLTDSPLKSCHVTLWAKPEKKKQHCEKACVVWDFVTACVSCSVWELAALLITTSNVKHLCSSHIQAFTVFKAAQLGLPWSREERLDMDNKCNCKCAVNVHISHWIILRSCVIPVSPPSFNLRKYLLKDLFPQSAQACECWNETLWTERKNNAVHGLWLTLTR